MRTRSLAALVAAVSLGVTACGSDGGGALSEGDFVDALADICDDVSRDLDRLDFPTDDDFGDFGRSAAEILNAGVEQMQELAPPEDLAPRLRELRGDDRGPGQGGRGPLGREGTATRWTMRSPTSSNSAVTSRDTQRTSASTSATRTPTSRPTRPPPRAAGRDHHGPHPCRPRRPRRSRCRSRSPPVDTTPATPAPTGCSAAADDELHRGRPHHALRGPRWLLPGRVEPRPGDDRPDHEVAGAEREAARDRRRHDVRVEHRSRDRRRLAGHLAHRQHARRLEGHRLPERRRSAQPRAAGILGIVCYGAADSPVWEIFTATDADIGISVYTLVSDVPSDLVADRVPARQPLTGACRHRAGSSCSVPARSRLGPGSCGARPPDEPGLH
jgi:hypothetical protein